MKKLRERIMCANAYRMYEHYLERRGFDDYQ